MAAGRRFSRISPRFATVVAAALLIGSAPFAGATAPPAAAHADDPDPTFQQPGSRPGNSTTHVPADPAAATPPAGAGPVKAGADDAEPKWPTHPEHRRTKAEAMALAKSSGQRVLVEDKLAEDSTEYANPDGTTTVDLTSGPSRVKRGNGWADIDTTLVRRGHDYEAAAIVGSLRLSGGGSHDLLTLGRGAHSFSLEWPAVLPEPRVDGAFATYPDVAPGVDLVIRVLRYGYEQHLVLHERPAKTPVFDQALRLPAHETVREGTSGLEILDIDGTVVGHLPQALMYDAVKDPRADEPTNKVLVPTSLVETADGPVLRYAPQASFLNDPERVYPVTIDPPQTLGVVSDTDVDSGFQTTPYAGSTELRVGTYNGGANKLYSYITFNTSAVAGADITSAYLNLYNFHSWSCTEKSIEVYRSTGTTNANTTYATRPAPAPTLYAASSFAWGYTTATDCSARYQAITLTNLTQYWADQGVSSAALRIDAGSYTDNYYWKKFSSGNGTLGDPYISATFNNIPTLTSRVPLTNATVNDLTPGLSVIVNDADGGSVDAQFYLKNSAGAWVSNGPIRSGTAGSRITYTVESGKLQDGQTYTWAVRGCDATQCSAPTTYIPFTVKYGPPPLAPSANATAGDSTTSVSWLPPADDGGTPITGYKCQLFRASDGYAYTAVVVDDLIRSCTDDTVQNGTSYYWKVSAINAAGTGPSQQSATVTPSRVPMPPQTVVATAGDTSSSVTWQPPASDGGSPVLDYTAKLYQNGNTTPVYTTTTATQQASKDSGLTNGTTYHWEITARNTRGSSTPASSNNVTPAGRPAPPTSVTATEQTRSNALATDPATVTVAWTPASDGGSPLLDYSVQAYVMPANTPYGAPVTACGGCSSVPVTGLQPGTRYVFGVVARNIVGTSQPEARSAEVLTHTPPAILKTVTDTAATSVLTDPATGRPLAGRGDAVRFTVTVSNTQSQPAQVDSVTDTLPAGMVLGGAVTVDGQPCTSGCSLNGSTLTLGGGYTLAAGASRAYSYVAILGGSERACVVNALNHVVVQGPYGLQSGSAATTACGSALGMEPWWSYLSAEVAAQSAASVNVANGNLVVQANDSTPVQAHGRLAYALRRTYNSQDPAALTLPGSLGAGWTFNVGQTADLAAEGVTATGLHVPRIGDTVDTLTEPLGVTLIDRDGTRHLFTPKVGLPAVALTGLSGPAAALAPSVLAAPSGTTLCVDVAYQAPAGVHLGLWRYVAVQPQSGSAPCANIAQRSPVVVGYAAVRPDRLRTEFNAVGQLVEMRDGAGVALRYLYDAPVAPDLLGKLRLVYEPRSCTPAGFTAPGCRQLKFDYATGATTVTDSAGRATRYEFGTPSIAGLPAGVTVLHRVVNPEETAGRSSDDHVDYSYQDDSDTSYGPTSCGGSRLQLCSVTDARGKRTTFHYDTAGSAAANLSALGRIDSVTDRRGTATAVTYPATDRTVAVRGGQQQRTFDNIDAYGRVGRQVDGPVGDATQAGYAALHVSTRTWDGDGAANCTQPLGDRANNLCKVVGAGSANDGNSHEATPDEKTEWLYNEQGQVLRERRTGTGANVDTTSGYRTQYVGSNGSALQTVLATDSVAAGGVIDAVRPAALASLTSIYAVSDRVELLTPRGNAAGSAFARYRTQWVVDADETKAPGAVVTAACPEKTATTGNTGLVCAETTPYGDEGDTTVATTSYGYNDFGEKEIKRTPRHGVYRYLYFEDSDQDLSDYVSAGGWLRAVTDPLLGYVAYGYDRAGNIVRTWDRDATDRSPYATTADFPVDAGVVGAAETRYADASFDVAITRPWRYARWQVTPTGDASHVQTDVNGNVERLTPPRGGAGSTSPLDTVTTFDAGGLPLTTQRGEDIARDVKTTNTYDAFGNLVLQVDQTGTPTVFTYDLVNRRTGTTVLRGAYPSDASDAPPACRKTTSADTAFGADRLVCSTTTAYDTLDNVVETVDADGQPTTTVYDALHRVVATVRPRSGSGLTRVTLRSENRYDVDGHVLDACTPRQTGGCSATSVYATHTAYDVAGRAVATTTYRDTGEAHTTRTTYDADGNATDIADPRQDADPGEDHTVNQAFDLNDRRVTSDMPRAGVTTYQYSPSGDVTGVVAPGATGDNSGSGGSGRAVRITGYTYDASHRPIDTVTALQVADADPAADPAAVRTATANAATDELAQTNLRTRKVYDEDGNVVAVFGPRAFAEGSVTAPDHRFMLRTEFDDSGRPVVQWSPRADGSLADDLTDDTTQAEQCPVNSGPATGLQYPAGTYVCKSTMTYDDDGNATEVGLPSKAGDTSPRKLVYAYTEDRLVRETKAPNPAADNTLVAVSTVLHDGSGRPVRTTNAAGHATLTTYTADGLVASVEGPDGPGGLTHTVTYEYDANGNRTKVVTPRPASADAPFTETTYYADNRVRAVYEGGDDGIRGDIVTSYEYDANGNPEKVTSPSANAHEVGMNELGASTVNTYTPDNLVLTTTAPVVVTATGVTQSRVTTYGYDDAGRKTSVDVDLTGSPVVDGAPQTFSYYPSGQLRTETGRGGGDTITNAYDANGALVQATAVSGSTTRVTSVGYYLDGQVRRVASDGRVTAYAYDGAGGRTALGEGNDNGDPLAVTHYTVNDAGLAVSMSSGDGGDIDWTYNALGQRTSENRGGRTQVWMYGTDDLLTQTAVASSAALASQVQAGTATADLASWSYTTTS